MKRKIVKCLSLALAALLQLAPMIRSALPDLLQGSGNSAWAIIFKWGVGAFAAVGCHAVSRASSIAISPPNATNGQPYAGTITYSGTHSASVSSMKLTNNCLTSAQFLVPGLTVVYSGVNHASVSGTPTVSGTFPFLLTMYDGSCGSGLSDARATSLIVGGVAGVAPAFPSPPAGGVAQVGSDVLLSAGASGTPAPRYYWKQGVTFIPGATNSILSFTNIQFTNAGLFTVLASNSLGTATATAFLSVCQTPGSNNLALAFTNYAAVSNAVVLTSYITNAPSGSNVYKYQYNFGDITSYSTSGSNLTIAANQAIALKSGIYSVVFNGVVGSTTVVNQQAYDSYWAFGVKPVIGTSPQSTNVNAGASVTLNSAATVQQNTYGNALTVGFLWYLNGTNLVSVQANPGTNQTASLSFASADPTNAGTYTVVATNFWGSTTSSPAMLSVTPNPAPPSTLNAQIVAGNGSFQLGFTNTPGASFTVLQSTNVNAPINEWLPLGSPTETSPGQYQFTDPGAQTNAERFYRVRSP